MLDWEDLRHFAAFLRERSLSGAARALRVDHATVARRIAALESVLDVKLIDRRSRAPLLTQDGERLAAAVLRIEDDCFAVERAAEAIRSGNSLCGEVTVTAPPAVASALIAPRLGELLGRYPRLRIRLKSQTRIVSLSRREADLAIRMSRPSDSELVARTVGSLTFSFYASPGYLASRLPSDYEFFSFDEIAEQPSPQHAWLLAQIGERPIVLYTNDLEAQRAAARSGIGIAFLPNFLGDFDAGLQMLSENHGHLKRDIWLAVHKDLCDAAPVRTVMDFLIRCFPQEPGLDSTTSTAGQDAE